MGITIESPLEDGMAMVESGKIEANGTAQRGTQTPARVHARVYAALPDPIPTNPPNDSVSVVPQGITWVFTNPNGVPEATCTEMPPHPTNHLVVWAVYASGGTPDQATVSFEGMCVAGGGGLPGDGPPAP